MRRCGSLLTGTGESASYTLDRHSLPPQDVVVANKYSLIPLSVAEGTRYADANMTQQDHDMTPPMRVTVEDAAKLMGLSIDAVRKRLERGTLRGEKVNGTRYVILDGDMNGHDSTGHRHDTDMTALLESQQDQIEFLREELRRKDHLLAAALERIPPALEAAPETPDSPPAGPGDATGGVSPEHQEPTQHRSWLYRFFFGP